MSDQTEIIKFQVLGFRSDVSSSKQCQALGEEFLGAIQEKTGIPVEWISSADEFTPDGLPLIYIQTGGTENLFAASLPQLPRPVRLLTSGVMNSLAASLEILTYLQNQGEKAEVIHGEVDYIAGRLLNLLKVQQTRQRLAGARLGVIGKPSDWLIASDVDPAVALNKLGCEIVEIPIQEMIDLSQQEYDIQSELAASLRQQPFPEAELKKALNIYGALKTLVEKYHLSGLTLRCFDLLEPLHNTGCIGLALLNAEGIPAACEGDVPALLSMMILNSLVGEPGFMVNPSRIQVKENRMVVAHCTLPLNMASSYSLRTHFESGIGVAVDGEIPLQRAMMFKVSADLERYFLSRLEVLSNLSEKNLCRTQIEIALDEDVRYFLTRPCGNHHLITLQANTALVEDFMRSLD